MCKVLCLSAGLLVVLSAGPVSADVSPVPLELRLGPSLIVYDAAGEGQKAPLGDFDVAGAVILFERLHLGLGGGPRPDSRFPRFLPGLRIRPHSLPDHHR